MGKNFWYFIGIIVVLVFLFVLFLALPSGQSKEEKAKAAATETALNQKISDLEKSLQVKIDEIDFLEKNCPQKKKPVVKSQTPNSGSVQKVIVEIRDLRTGAGTSGTVGVVGNGTNGTTKSAKIVGGGEADYNVREIINPKTTVNIDKKEKPLCVRIGDGVDARFWPHLAMLDLEEFPEAIHNDDGGYNLSLMPGGTLETIDPNKDYGITEDLIFWVRANRLDQKWADLPKYIMTSAGFKPAELYNGLYIAK